MRRLGMTLLLGAATGALFLGAGGRLVMRLFALATGRFPTFSVRGARNVVLAGAMAGALGGWLPKPPWLRGLTFSAVCYLVAIPGFRPPQPLVFALFAPVFLAYGFTVVMLWGRVVDRPAPGQRTVPP